METPNIEPTNVETPNTVNPNMKTCKHCGHIVAKNAKTCPSCGGKLKKNLGCLIGCLIPVIIVLVCILLLFNMCGIKTGSIGTKYKYTDIGEFTVTSIEVYSPVELVGTGLVSALEDGESAIIVKFDFENTGNVNMEIDAEDVKANYNNGARYDGEYLYILDDPETFTLKEHSVTLEKVTSDKESFMVIVPIPEEAAESKSSLSVEMYNREYTIY